MVCHLAISMGSLKPQDNYNRTPGHHNTTPITKCQEDNRQPKGMYLILLSIGVVFLNIYTYTCVACYARPNRGAVTLN